ncbi:MAG TPA: helix-turn-helix transcriptional regulator [Candidatus Acidoferrales bacterium]
MTKLRAAAETLGEFEQIVLLALVRLGDDAYGATIRREIEKRTGRELSISAVYTTLDRLETKGLVRSFVGQPTPERGGRRKRFYTLEAAGEEALAASYRTYKGMVSGLERLLEKL